jgi:hypothetical protein
VSSGIDGIAHDTEFGVTVKIHLSTVVVLQIADVPRGEYATDEGGVHTLTGMVHATNSNSRTPVQNCLFQHD